MPLPGGYIRGLREKKSKQKIAQLGNCMGTLAVVPVKFMPGDCECLVEHPNCVPFTDRLRCISIKPLVKAPQDGDCDASHSDLQCSSRVACEEQLVRLICRLFRRVLAALGHLSRGEVLRRKFYLRKLPARAVELVDEHNVASMRWRRYSLFGAILKDRKRRLACFESRYRILAVGDSFEHSTAGRSPSSRKHQLKLCIGA